MAKLLNKVLIAGSVAMAMTACASSVPANFQYETSVRGEQGFIGRSDKISAAESLLNAGVVKDPAEALRAALPDADIRVRRWGLQYFGSNWARYQVVLNADISQGKDTVKCREVSTDTPSGAPTLKDLRANSGAELQTHLEALVSTCLARVPKP